MRQNKQVAQVGENMHTAMHPMTGPDGPSHSEDAAGSVAACSRSVSSEQKAQRADAAVSVGEHYLSREADANGHEAAAQGTQMGQARPSTTLRPLMSPALPQSIQPPPHCPLRSLLSGRAGGWLGTRSCVALIPSLGHASRAQGHGMSRRLPELFEPSFTSY